MFREHGSSVKPEWQEGWCGVGVRRENNNPSSCQGPARDTIVCTEPVPSLVTGVVVVSGGRAHEVL